MFAYAISQFSDYSCRSVVIGVLPRPISKRKREIIGERLYTKAQKYREYVSY